MTDIKEQFCGTCKWHHRETVDDGWVCVNLDSDYCTCPTWYDDWCPDWEGKT